MKKIKINPLKLKKKVISKLNSETLTGGKAPSSDTDHTISYCPFGDYMCPG